MSQIEHRIFKTVDPVDPYEALQGLGAGRPAAADPGVVSGLQFLGLLRPRVVHEKDDIAPLGK